MSSETLHFTSIVDLSSKMRSGAVTPTFVTEMVLSRIAALDGALKSYTTVLAERSIAKAKQAEAEICRGFWRGPLHGVPIAVKDLCYTSYAPTSAGMKINAAWVPDYSATVVDRLERAGAIILGKLTMTEGAFIAYHPEMPKPTNPWDARRWTGASSSGSGVATAAGLCFGSLGSDSGGSIRFPSACNGLTGVKPTWGRVSRYGVVALSESLDHVGPMTRTAADAAAMLAVLAGTDPNDPTTESASVPNYLAALGGGVRGLRIGIDESYIFNDVDPEVAKVASDAIAAFVDLGARIVPVHFQTLGRSGASWMRLCAVEAAIAHEKTYPSRAAEYGPELSAFLAGVAQISAADLGKAQLERNAVKGLMSDLFETIDLLLVPVIPIKVPTTTEWDALITGGLTSFLRYTAIFSFSGNPTITLNGGFDSNGLPVGFQLVGRHLSEEVLLNAGDAFQSVTDWHTRHPEMPVAEIHAAAA